MHQRKPADPIVLPQPAHIELVISRAPSMIPQMIRAAMATGCREDELLRAARGHYDRARRQLTVIGKRNKLRVINLEHFDGYKLFDALTATVGPQRLFWHGKGEPYLNFASNFSALVRRTAAWANANGEEFRPFTFHALRHWHAVEWLKAGKSIYDLQQRLAHSSIKTTEVYLDFLTPEEARVAKQQTG